MKTGYQVGPHRIRASYFFRMAVAAAMLLLLPSAFAQTLGISVTNRTVNVRWPQTNYYYVLQSTTNLCDDNCWSNTATASLISSLYADYGNVVPITTAFSQPAAGVPRFFRLKPPVIPIFGFAIFYQGPLEFTWCATMDVIGTVHANAMICVGTSASLTFSGNVTATGVVGGPTRDGSSPSPWSQNTTFRAGYITNVPAFVSPFGTNNPHVLIDIPPASEYPTSALGLVREYNYAQVLILVTNTLMVGHPPATRVTFTLQNSPAPGELPGEDPNKITYTYFWTNYVYTNYVSHIMVTNSIFTNFSFSIWEYEPHGIEQFLSVTNTFTDKREYQTNMFVTQINVGAYSKWLSTNGFNTTKFDFVPPTILYVADQRNVGTNKLAVVRLVNGAALPQSGFGWTVVTPNPLYVKGDYNVTRDGVHFAYAPGSTTNSPSCTVPAALMCDAITSLSSSFNDITSSSAIGTATVSNTVNAAIIAGNVPSTGTTATTFSGGVQNLIRWQENWSSSTCILNTSLVCLWASQMATNQFRNPTGFSPAPINPYYSPPTRLWSFDPNFYNIAKLPPGTPYCTLP